MSVLQSVQTALSGAGFAVGEGEYPNTPNDCGKVVYTGTDKPIRFMGQAAPVEVETFKVIVRGHSYRTLETMATTVKGVLTGAGFIQIGGYEDIEPKEGETFMQLAVSFKVIQ